MLCAIFAIWCSVAAPIHPDPQPKVAPFSFMVMTVGICRDDAKIEEGTCADSDVNKEEWWSYWSCDSEANLVYAASLKKDDFKKWLPEFSGLMLNSRNEHCIFHAGAVKVHRLRVVGPVSELRWLVVEEVSTPHDPAPRYVFHHAAEP